MRYFRISLAFTILAITILTTVIPAACATPRRGVVVDRGDKDVIWLGLAEPATKGTVFEIRLLPTSKAISRARLLADTTDYPYVAPARLRMIDPSGFLPTGSYVEAVNAPFPDTDEKDKYQSVTPGHIKGKPLMLLLGAFFPTNSSLRSETKSVWPTFELSYSFSHTRGMNASVGLGYLASEGNSVTEFSSVHRDFKAIPLTLESRMYANSKANNKAYLKLGVGAYWIRDKRNVNGIEDDRELVTFGWQAGVGTESHSGQSVELSYLNASRDNLRGLTLLAGARFLRSRRLGKSNL